MMSAGVRKILRANGFVLSAVLPLAGCSDRGVASEHAPLVAQVSAADDDACDAPDGDISSSSRSLFEAETRVARAPDGSMVAVWVSDPEAPDTGGFQSIGYRVYRPHCEGEGRSGWGPVQLLAGPASFYNSDPSVAADDDGNFYIAFIDAEGPLVIPPTTYPSYPEDQLRVYASRLRRNAKSADAPVLVSRTDYSFNDKPWITVTPRGALVVSYYDSDIDTGRAIVARSTDQGATWTHAVMDPSVAAFLPQVCVGAHSKRIYATDVFLGEFGDDANAHREFAPIVHRRLTERLRARLASRHGRQTARPAAPITPGPSGDPSVPAIHLHWSDDDGVTWNESGFNQWPGDANLGFSIPTCAAFGKDVWLAQSVATTLDFPPLAQKVTVSHFTNSGATFVADATPVLDGAHFFDQPLVVADGEGRVNVLTQTALGYFNGTTGGRFVRARSVDRGVTFGAADVLASNIWNGGRRHGIGWLGDYVGADPRRDGSLDVTFVAPGLKEPSHVIYAHLPR